VFLLTVMGWRDARAESTSPVSLEWSAPRECPNKEYVHAQIKRLLGSTEASGDDKPVTARATVARRGSEWRTEIATESEGAEGLRSFQGETCRAVADTTALILALMVNPQKVARYRSQTKPPETPPPAPPPTNVVPSPAPPATSPPRIMFGSAAIFGIADFGTVPTTGLGAGLSVGLVVRRLRVEALVAGEPSHSSNLTSTPGIGARFRGLRAGIRMCVALLTGELEVSPCVGGEAVWMSAQGFGITKPDENATRWEEVTPGAWFRWAFFHDLALRLEAALQIPLRPGQFTIAPLGVVHVVPPVTGRTVIGIDLRF
jgi:hypothetical protein